MKKRIFSAALAFMVSAAGGARDVALEYADCRDLYLAWCSYQYDHRFPSGVEITLSDGTVVTDDGFREMYMQDMQSVIDGTGALAFPDETAWNKCHVLEGGGGGDPGGGEEPGGEDPEQNPFSKIRQLVVGSGFLAGMGDFLMKVWNGEIGGLDRDAYFFPADLGIEGINGVCEYFYNGVPSREMHGYVVTGNSDAQDVYVINYINPDDYPLFCVVYDSGLWIYQYKNGGQYSVCADVGGIGTLYRCSDLSTGELEVVDWPWTFVSGIVFLGCISYSLSIPVFSDLDSGLNYFRTGGISGLLNGECYDYPDLVGSIPETLAPLTGIRLNPNALPGLNTALSSAVQALPAPDPAADPAKNNETYRNTVLDTVTELAPAAQVSPAPDPEPEPAPEPVPGEGGIDDYKADLTMIFPFCIPFDFIRLLEALDAEPVTPCFHFPFVVESLGIDMDVELSLAFLDDVMEVFRLGELGLWVLLLIGVTSKVIRW